MIYFLLEKGNMQHIMKIMLGHNLLLKTHKYLCSKMYTVGQRL